MKSMKEIREELIREGARVRLLELNHERDVLLKIVGHDDSRKEAIIKHITRKKYKGKHWTQLPKNRERLRKILLKMNKVKKAKYG